MCSELIDLRAKITNETDAWLDAMTHATGKDRSELVRDVLHKIALEKINEVIVQYNKLQSKGIAGNAQGVAGNAEGMRGKVEGVAGNGCV